MTQKKLLQILLVGFPIGLAVLIVIALFLYYWEPGGGEEKDRRGASVVGLAGARPVSEEGVGRTMDVLVNIFGERASTDADAVRKTANYLESTMGPRNIGFFVERVPHPSLEAAPEGLLVVERGRREPNVVTVLVAEYDTPPDGGDDGLVRNSCSVAVTVAVAQALVGSEPDQGYGFFFATREWDEADIVGVINAAGFRAAKAMRLTEVYDFELVVEPDGSPDLKGLTQLGRETEEMLSRAAFRR